MSTLLPTTEFATARPRLPLDGAWAFSYDPDDAGVRERWFAEGHALPESLMVPGCSQTQPFASAGTFSCTTDVYIPEQSRDIMLRYGCMAPSWYQQRFTVPAEWAGREIALHLGGVKPAADAWLNGQYLGGTLTSRSPVRADLTSMVRVGEENTLTLRLHWPELRLDGMYDIIVAWSGLYRPAWVEAAAASRLADIFVQTAIDPPAATVRVQVAGAQAGLRLECDIIDAEGRVRYHGAASVNGATAALPIPMHDAALWSTWAPNLYHATVRLYQGETLLDQGTMRFGLRELTTRGRQVMLNGTPIFLRGACDDHIYPESICPPADTDEFRRRVRQTREYGFNYMKGACEVFLPEYLDAADEQGFLVCQEMPFGMCGELRAIRNDPPDELIALWRRELTNIVASCRNHPAVGLYSMTSEHYIESISEKSFRVYYQELPALTRRLAPGTLIFDSTGGGHFEIETKFGKRNTDLLEDCTENSYSLEPGQGPLPVPPLRKPFVLHEWNWICSLPDPSIIDRYEGLPTQAVQVPEMIAAAKATGIADELSAMAAASRPLKYALRRHALEQALTHPYVAGYHHWLVHDISYCPEGVFDEFRNEQPGMTAQAFRGYNDDTVVLLDDPDRRTFAYGQAVPLGARVVHFGPTPLQAPELRWQVTREGDLLAEGRKVLASIACGARVNTGRLGLPRLRGDAPAKLELTCELWEGNTRVTHNAWPLWVFPDRAVRLPAGVDTAVPLPASFRGAGQAYDRLVPRSSTRVFITHRLTDGVGDPLEGLLTFLENGGRVLLLANGVLPETYGGFYRTVPYVLGRVGNMGTLVRPHPALGDFPHEGWCDRPFVPLIQGAFPLRLDAFSPAKIHPIIRSIPHPVTMEDKAYLFEIGIGRGVLLATTLNLATHAHTDPAARHLLANLIHYLASEPCAPETILDRETLLKAMGK